METDEGKIKNSFRRWWWIYLLAIFSLIAGGTVAFFESEDRGLKDAISEVVNKVNENKTGTSHDGALDLNKVWSRGKCKGSGMVTFNTLPMRYEDFAIYLPYGLVVDAHVTPIDHSYFSPTIFNSPRDTYEVRAVADGYIVQVGRRDNFVGEDVNAKKPSEYRLDIEHNCTVYSYFDLITSLAPEIAKEVPDILSGKKQNGNVRIPVKEGQLIGRIGGQTLDFGVYNNEVWLDFINPDSYTHEAWKIHTDDPFKYFNQSLTNQILSKNPRQAEPRAGKIDYDIQGRLIGNWFKENTKGYGGINQERYWDGHLALLYDAFDPAQIVFSTGDFGGKSKQLGVMTGSVDPKDVSVETGMVKYELSHYEYSDSKSGQRWDQKTAPPAGVTAKLMPDIQGVALLQLIENGKLKVEVFPGKTAAEVTGFSDKAIVYER